MLFHVQGLTKEQMDTVTEIFSDLGHAETQDGTAVTFEKRVTDSEGGVCIIKKDGAFHISYQTTTEMIRGLALLFRYVDEKDGFSKTEVMSCETLGTMVDCSRNSVMNLKTAKKFIRTTAMMGLNAMMLYTEDTYEVPSEPYFGHLRGRYTQKELKELDFYAERFGIELIPCIQTLAHMNAIFKWGRFADLVDWDDILNIADDRAYELIDKTLASMSESIRSRKINIGMDEAYILGRGRYLEKKGYHTSNEIMQEHLEKIMVLCKKYGYEPRMWSDMYFRMCTEDHQYYSENCVVTEDVVKIVPPEVTLVYWDYYGVKKEKYDRMLDNHLKFNNRIAFAGGSSCWYGLIPLSQFSINSARVAIESAKEHGIDEIFITMWGDDGGMCSPFGSIPTIGCYGESFWSGKNDDESLEKAVLAETGASYRAFMDLEKLMDLPGRTSYGERVLYPTRYAFYQDVLQGKFDAHIPDGSNAHYAECAELFRGYVDRNETGTYRYLFETVVALCDVLSLKAEIGKELKKAYDANDQEALKQFSELKIPAVLEAVDEFHDIFRKEWMKDFKAFGFDIQDIRIGGLESRLREACAMIDEYLNGDIETIEELDAPRLQVREPHEGDGVMTAYDAWSRIASAGVMSHQF